MPLMYNQIPLHPQGMIWAESFALPGDGRKVFFDIFPGGTFRKDIFLIVDGKFQDDPFANGSRLETPVRGFERLIPGPHEAFALVVDRTEQILPAISIPITPIPVTFLDGQNAVVKLSGTLRASISPKDPARLARDYAVGAVSTAEGAASTTLRSAVIRAAVSLVPATLKNGLPNETIGQLGDLALDLAQDAAEQTERALRWCQVSSCEVELAVENADELMTASNFTFNMRTETQRRLLDAILTTFGTSPLPAEVSQVLLAYVQANPGLPAADIKDFCQGIHSIWQRTTPAALLLAAQQVGILPASKGGP